MNIADYLNAIRKVHAAGVAPNRCEHMDINTDVVKPASYSKEQKERYRQGLPKLICTNGLDFELQ
ncbi:MAG: hypothetical protein ACN4E6_15280 [Qipengyuania pacifica]